MTCEFPIFVVREESMVLDLVLYGLDDGVFVCVDGKERKRFY